MKSTHPTPPLSISLSCKLIPHYTSIILSFFTLLFVPHLSCNYYCTSFIITHPTNSIHQNHYCTTTTTTTTTIQIPTKNNNIPHKPTSFPSSTAIHSLRDSATYDLAILGAGPVGVHAALLASSTYHKSVILIDAPKESGTLYNEQTQQDLSIGGPTGLFSKALRDTSKRIRVDSLRGMGLREESIWNEIMSSCVDLATLNANDVNRQLEFANVDYIEGLGGFPDGGMTNELFISSKEGMLSTIRAEHVLIATGSKPFRPGGVPFDGKRIFDSDSINQLSYLPSSIAITGSGIIAIEYAKIFRNLGADVTLIIRDNIPRNALMKIGLDKDIAATLVADLIRSGIKIEKGADVSSFEVPHHSATLRAPIKINLRAKGGGSRPPGTITELKCDAYLAAVGRKPNTANLNLLSAGIEVDRYGGLVVDENLCTTACSGNVYGAGDVCGRPFLASTGVAQAAAVVKHLFDDSTKNPPSNTLENDATPSQCNENETNVTTSKECFDPKSLTTNPFAYPIGVWSSPEAAYYGYSTLQAKQLGIDAGEGMALYCECIRGLVFNPNGILKLVFDKSDGRVIGVHVCGEDACELIHYGMELVKSKRTIVEVVNTLYSAVTFHELYKIAALAALDEAGARKRRAIAGAALAARNRGLKK